MQDVVLPERHDDETLLDVARTVLAERPEARIIAVDPDTLGDRRDVLHAAGFDPRQVVSGLEQVAEVAPVDQARFVAHALRVAEERAVVETVALANGTMAEAGLYDLRATIGVYIGILVPLGQLAVDEPEVDRRPSLPARVGRVRIGTMGEVLDGDDASAELLGLEGRDTRDLNAFDLIHLDDRRSLLASFLAVQGAAGGTDRCRGRLVRADGSYLWTEISFRRVDDGPEPCTEVELVDISLEMSEHEQLVERERLLDGLTRSLPVGVLQIDDQGAVRFSNHAVASLTGVATPDTAEAAFANVVVEDRGRLDAAIERALRAGEDQDIEVRLAPAPGVPDRICSLIIRSLAGDDGQAHGAVVCVQDVTAQAMARADLETRIIQDPLTRSLNRDGIMDHLNRCLAGHQRRESDGAPGGTGAEAGKGTAVIYIDLDDFKQINDRFGHRAGDGVLRAATERIRDGLRDGDVVGRIGGDEFVAICAAIDSPAAALAIAERIADLLALPLTHPQARLRASIGVVTAPPGDPRTAEALLADGDAAMYESKRAHLGRPVVFAGGPG